VKILYVITSLRTGGAEKLVVELTCWFREKGHSVDVALFDGIQTDFMQDLEKTGCKIYRFSTSGSFYSPYYPRRIFQLARVMNDYDIVHTHNTSPQFFAAIAHLFRRKPLLVTTEHNTTNDRRNKKWFLPLDRWMYNRYRKVICISDKAYDNLVSYLKHTKADVLTIKNGVNLKTFRQASPIEGFKKEGIFAIVMVAAFRPQKDQGTLIKAMAHLPLDCHLFLAGEGETWPGLEELSKTLGVEERVHFLGLRKDVPQILKSSDVVVMSSHYEGLSLSSIEGMAVDKPFVASDVDGLHEIVEGAGILVPHQDEKALAEVLLKLKEDSALRASVAASCMERASQYDFSKMAEAYLKVYSDILGEKK
jgi:glycosyltransferase involved in cell wall biosynthesis